MSISFYQPPALPENEQRRDGAVRRFDALGIEADPVLEGLVHALARRLDASVSMLSLLRGEIQRVVAAHGLPTGIYSRRQSFCGHAVAEGTDLFCVPDLSLDPRFAGNPWVSGDAGRLRFYAAALVRDSAGEALGAVCVADERPRGPTGTFERALLGDAAEQARRRLETLHAAANPGTSFSAPARAATPIS